MSFSFIGNTLKTITNPIFTIAEIHMQEDLESIKGDIKYMSEISIKDLADSAYDGFHTYQEEVTKHDNIFQTVAKGAKAYHNTVTQQKNAFHLLEYLPYVGKAFEAANKVTWGDLLKISVSDVANATYHTAKFGVNAVYYTASTVLYLGKMGVNGVVKAGNIVNSTVKTAADVFSSSTDSVNTEFEAVKAQKEVHVNVAPEVAKVEVAEETVAPQQYAHVDFTGETAEQSLLGDYSGHNTAVAMIAGALALGGLSL